MLKSQTNGSARPFDVYIYNQELALVRYHCMQEIGREHLVTGPGEKRQPLLPRRWFRVNE